MLVLLLLDDELLFTLTRDHAGPADGRTVSETAMAALPIFGDGAPREVGQRGSGLC